MAFNPITLAAEGGIITYDSAYRIHTFTKSGMLLVKTPMNVQVLVVGGGGGGGTSSGGGGGGGGVQTNSSLAVTSQSYPVIVGLGGAGRTSGALSGFNGGNSTFSTITAIGGGGGGGYEALGGNGSCGGGGGSSATSGNQKIGGTGSQGYNGGNGAYYSTGHAGAGGGGGAGAVGANAVNTVAGAGGSGLASTITGSTVYYAGGGGGGGNSSGAGAVGGIGGGGDGSTGASNAISGAANTGGGGGGARTWGSGNSANGGSGIVIIRYPVSADGFTSFTHRKRITINNSSGGTLTNYQVPVTIAYATAMRPDFGDIRFTSSDGSNITYWIESKTDSTTAAVWLRLDLLTGDNILYMYYGNPALVDVSSEYNIFDAYDLTSYVEVDPGSYYTVTSNKVDVVAIPNSSAGLTKTVVGVGDFAYDCEIYRSTMTGDGGMHILLADSVSYPAWNSWGSNNGIGFTLMNNANSSYAMVEKYVSGTRTGSGAVYFDINTLYYITLTRVGSTLTLNVYTNVARTTHRTGSPCILTGVPTTAFTKLLVAQNDSVYGGAKTYYIQNPHLRKYATSIPTVIIASEETPANITATLMTISTSESPCRVGICTVTVNVTWTNNGGTSGDFIPNITIDGIPYSSPYTLESLGSGLSVIKTFTISGLAVGTRNICPYPN